MDDLSLSLKPFIGMVQKVLRLVDADDCARGGARDGYRVKE